MKGRVGTGRVDEVLGPGEKVRGLTVAASAVQRIRWSDRHAADKVAAHEKFTLSD